MSTICRRGEAKKLSYLHLNTTLDILFFIFLLQLTAYSGRRLNNKLVWNDIANRDIDKREMSHLPQSSSQVDDDVPKLSSLATRIAKTTRVILATFVWFDLNSAWNNLILSLRYQSHIDTSKPRDSVPTTSSPNDFDRGVKMLDVSGWTHPPGTSNTVERMTSNHMMLSPTLPPSSPLPHSPSPPPPLSIR